MGIFKFKQFTVNDDNCSMKVGTDAVLLGAWCEVGDAKRVLDIGTGSGVIALMMAQRSNGDAFVDAVELLPRDAAQARENMLTSPWAKKVSVITIPVQDYHPTSSYDLIICNPPYFVKSLLPLNADRRVVRHCDTLPHRDLIDAIRRLLLPSGIFHLILPTTESALFCDEAASLGLHLHTLTRFFSRKGKPQQRALMTFGLAPQNLRESSLYLYGQDRLRTAEYIQLIADFYL